MLFKITLDPSCVRYVQRLSCGECLQLTMDNISVLAALANLVILSEPRTALSTTAFCNAQLSAYVLLKLTLWICQICLFC